MDENEPSSEITPVMADIVVDLTTASDLIEHVLGQLTLYYDDLERLQALGPQPLSVVRALHETLDFASDEIHTVLASAHLYMSGMLVPPQYFHDVEGENAA